MESVLWESTKLARIPTVNKGLKVNVEIPEGKSVSETYPRENPHTLPIVGLERFLGQPLEALLGPNLV